MRDGRKRCSGVEMGCAWFEIQAFCEDGRYERTEDIHGRTGPTGGSAGETLHIFLAFRSSTKNTYGAGSNTSECQRLHPSHGTIARRDLASSLALRQDLVHPVSWVIVLNYAAPLVGAVRFWRQHNMSTKPS